MAGAGYKLFATGDVLTAAQVNTYLMQQTVMVFASSAARTTALSGVLAEGMVSYLQDSNTLEVYDGSAWVGATGDITGLTAGTGISISSATGPVPTVTNSMATEITAKGDLIVGTGSGTFDNLAAGSNGDTIVADSSTATGLRYQATYEAGKNLLINGLLDIWQRSTSVTGQANGYATVDRWYLVSDASCTFAQESTIVPTGCRYSQKVTVGASASSTQAYQAVETSNVLAYAGKNVTFSGRFQSSATPAITMIVEYSTDVDKGLATGGWIGITATSGSTGTAGSSSFTTVSGVYAIPSTAKSLRFSFYSGSMASGSILYYGGFQAELGVVVTSLVRNGATLQGELAACQRYYYRQTSTYVTGTYNLGNAITTGLAYVNVLHPVSMRIPPAAIEVPSTITNIKLTNIFSTNYTITSASYVEGTPNNTVFAFSTSGLTAGQPVWLGNNSTTAGFVGVSAEL